jgi:hypothetical protein
MAAIAVTLFQVGSAFAASVRTQNFIVSTPDPVFARQVAEAAEQYRADLAHEWLGQELPPWPQPCPITVQAAPNLGAGGATSFTFDRGYPSEWTMSIQGSRERILDSVLPHEVTHTVFATHFGRPVPRWADEGACTTVEHPSERAKQHQFLQQFLTTGRGIPFNKMFRMTEYPHDIMPLYSQGHSVAQFLIAQGGRRQFIDFVGHGMATRDWDNAVDKFYQFRDLSDLQLTWVDWVKQGCPEIPAGRAQLASNGRAPGRDVTRQVASNQISGPETGSHSQSAWQNRDRQAPVAQLASASRDSWYARQREVAVTDRQQDFGPPSVIATRSTARGQDLQQAHERVLEWNPNSAPSESSANVARAPRVPTQYSTAESPVWR